MSHMDKRHNVSVRSVESMDAEQDPSLSPPVSGGCNFHRYINPQKPRKPDRTLSKNQAAFYPFDLSLHFFSDKKLTRSFSPHGTAYNLHAIFTSGAGVVGNGQHKMEMRFPSRNCFRFFFQGDFDADFLSYSCFVMFCVRNFRSIERKTTINNSQFPAW